MNRSFSSSPRRHLQRSLLKARIADGQQRHWLLFGERSASHDFYFVDQLLNWKSTGRLAHLDTAFSRSAKGGQYVQDCLAERIVELKPWLKRGAVIYVCGSRTGMGQAVDQLLRQALGDESVNRLLVDGRYRRDIY